MDITNAFIESIAPDASSAKDGRVLVNKKKFSNLHTDEGKTLLFGECAGSGANPYSVSVDFLVPSNPVPRCSCPSRKFPCKHALGLLYAYIDNPSSFTVASIPESVLSKREKLDKKSAKKEEDAPIKEKTEKEKESAKKKKASTELKKTEAQLTGLLNARERLFRLVRDGLGTLTPKALDELKQGSLSLGDSYLPGLQKFYLDLVEYLHTGEDGRREAVNALLLLHSLIKRGAEFLEKRKENTEFMELATDIEALLGRAWRLNELQEAGLCAENGRLAQLSFSSYYNAILRQTEETGVWLDLSDGAVYLTRDMIPDKGRREIEKSKKPILRDSLDGVLQTPLLYKYPGGLNRRVRWDDNDFTVAPFTPADTAKITALAESEFAAVVKKVKEHIKNPLSDKNPFLFVRFKGAAQVEGELVLEDGLGGRIALSDAAGSGFFSTLESFKNLGGDMPRFSACLLRFNYEVERGRLTAAPLTLVGESDFIRLGF